MGPTACRFQKVTLRSGRVVVGYGERNDVCWEEGIVDYCFVVVVMGTSLLLGGIVVRRGWSEKVIGGTGG